jgi:hypothetical protein
LKYRIYPTLLPCEGGREFPVALDFATYTEITLDFSTAQSLDKLSMLRSLFIDNEANGSPVQFEIPVSHQIFTIPANAQGYMPFFAPNPPLIIASSAGGVAINVNMLNMYTPPLLWGAASGGLDFLLLESGGKIVLESGSGFILLE